VRKDVIQREGKDADEKVDVDSIRDNIGGVGREGEGGRDGDRVRGECDTVSDRRGGMLTDPGRGGGGGGANVFSEAASLRASSNGLTTVVSTAVLTGSTSVLSIWTAESGIGCGCGCGGCGVAVPEGTADVGADGIGDDDGNGDDDDGDGSDDEACSCQYMGSSSCSSSSVSKPCWFRTVAARASAKNSALGPKRRPPEGTLKGLASRDESCARGSSEAGTDTKAPKSESVELAELIEPTGGRGLEGRVNIDEEADRRGEAGGVAGEKSVAKRSSRSGLDGGGGMGVPLPAGTGIRGGFSGEGIRDFGFGSESSVREREGLSQVGVVNNVDIGRSTEAEGNTHSDQETAQTENPKVK
jgi:hypothetical protein